MKQIIMLTGIMSILIALINLQDGNIGLALMWCILVFMNLKSYTNIQRKEKEALQNED